MKIHAIVKEELGDFWKCADMEYKRRNHMKNSTIKLEHRMIEWCLSGNENE